MNQTVRDNLEDAGELAAGLGNALNLTGVVLAMVLVGAAGVAAIVIAVMCYCWICNDNQVEPEQINMCGLQTDPNTPRYPASHQQLGGAPSLDATV
jgi:hypothetical protein